MIPSPVRVVFLWRHFYWHPGGVVTLLRDLLDGLPARGIEPFVLTLRELSPHRDALRQHYGHQVRECLHPLPYRLHRDYLWPERRLPLAERIVRRLRRPLSRASLAAALFRLRADIVVYNEAWLLSGSMPGTRGVRVALWHSQESAGRYQPATSRAHHHIAVSPPLADVLRQRGATQVSTIASGVHWPASPRLRPAGGPLRIAYVGRFTADDKRVLDLVRICRRLNELGAAYRLTLVGDGPLRVRLLSGLDECNVGFDYRGALERAAVREIWANHDAMLLTSAHEGGPLVLLEAMAGGCIPVASRCGGLVPRLVRHGETGFAFEVGDVHTAAAHLQRLYADAGLRLRMAGAAHRAVGQFSAETMLDDYAALFRRLASAPGAKPGKGAL